jgi:16S rRNA (cytosine967-C5)-methyltransferase
LDAPCSALGTFRRNPDVISKIDRKKLKINQDIQLKMVDKSLNLLNNGGVLVYIVCSFHSFETMGVIDKILQKHKNITVVNIQSDKMIKKENGYFINPYSFKEYGGADIFYVAVLRKQQ